MNMSIAIIKESSTEKIINNIDELNKDTYYHVGLMIDGKVILLRNKEILETHFKSTMQFYDEKSQLQQVSVSLNVEGCPDWIEKLHNGDMIYTLCNLKDICITDNNKLILFDVI